MVKEISYISYYYPHSKGGKSEVQKSPGSKGRARVRIMAVWIWIPCSYLLNSAFFFKA